MRSLNEQARVHRGARRRGGVAAGVVCAAIGKIPRIGVLWHAGNEQEEGIYLGTLRKGLNDLGYEESRNIELLSATVLAAKHLEILKDFDPNLSAVAALLIPIHR